MYSKRRTITTRLGPRGETINDSVEYCENPEISCRECKHWNCNDRIFEDNEVIISYKTAQELNIKKSAWDYLYDCILENYGIDYTTNVEELIHTMLQKGTSNGI